MANITGKASSVYGFIRRNFNNCPAKIKSALYKNMVRPILEYASNVWSPYHNKDIQHIEAVQRRAARFTVNCYSRYQSILNILQKLKWPTLEERRNELKLIMMYKIVHGHVHIQPILPVIRSFSNGTIWGHNNRFLKPATRTNIYKYSFSPTAVKLWNSLQIEVINA